MCCLFGLIDTELRFTGKEKSKINGSQNGPPDNRNVEQHFQCYGPSQNLGQ